jgi:serine/threonine protein kinase
MAARIAAPCGRRAAAPRARRLLGWRAMAQALVAHARPPESPGPYRIVGTLGHGGMGIVYHGRDPRTGLEVAIKTVRSPDESDASGLRREIDALWRLCHAGVVRILEDGTFRGCPWFAMELLHGTTLRRLHGQLWPDGRHRPEVTTRRACTGIDDTTLTFAPLPAGPPIPPAAAVRGTGRPPAAGGRLREVLLVMRRLCNTLAFVHGNGYVHRDLKPTNVFLRPDGSPVLVDFGLVCRFPGPRAREALEPAGLRVGTVHYMAPEQIRGELVDARADMYSLGCLLYEAVTGQRPFEGRSAEAVAEQQLHSEASPPGLLVCDLPPGLEHLIRRLMIKDPRERTAHAEDVAEDLAALAGAPAPPRISHGRTPYFFRPTAAGRRATLGELERALNAGIHGRGAMILLAGERGMGRTLLLGQTARQGAVRDYRVVTGRCLPLDRSLPSPLRGDPFETLLRVVADRCRRGGPAAASRYLGPRASELAALEPALRWVDLGPQERDPPSAAPAGQPQRHDAAEALVRALEGLAGEQRVLLALDDLQWADPLTLAVLRMLTADRLTRLPLLVLGAYRSEDASPELSSLAAATGARTLTLGPLSEDALTALVSDLLALPRPPAALVKLMERRSLGNPARLIEALHAAAADGLLVRRRGRWVVTQQPRRAFWLRETVRHLGPVLSTG